MLHPCQDGHKTESLSVYLIGFYFGVLHPVARTLSKLLEEPSLATTI
jgi:hypothetical protein